ncbi:MAG: RidA family protein [Clostridia bacterium]|nr:RidA family protein [Clostridia bacterium]
MSSKKIIATDQAPAAVGPYSQAVQIGRFVFTSGQLPLDPASGKIVAGGIKEQTERTLANLQAVLAAAGADLEDVVKTTLYIKNMDDFSTINEIYGKYFHDKLPARSCVEAARLPKDVLIEVEAIAVVEK